MGMPRSCSCRRLRCSPVYVKQSGDHGSTYQDRGLCPRASGHVPHHEGTTILLHRSAHLSVAPLAPCSRFIPTLCPATRQLTREPAHSCVPATLASILACDDISCQLLRGSSRDITRCQGLRRALATLQAAIATT